MGMFKVNTGQIQRNGKPWVGHVEVATSMVERMRGLLGRHDLPVGQGLLIEACGAVHTVGMHFPIDVIFLDRAWQVRRVFRNVRPGRLMVWGGWYGLCALEVSSGWLDLSDVTPGTPLEWRALKSRELLGVEYSRSAAPPRGSAPTMRRVTPGASLR